MNVYPVSADDHCWEKPDTWTSRVPAKLKEDAPQLKRIDNKDYWVYAGEVVRPLGTGCAALMPERRNVDRWEEVPKAAYDARERLKIMDSDGVAVEVLFPQAAGFGTGPLIGKGDPAIRLASIQAFNDYLAEEWLSVSPRFVPQCLLPVYDLELAIKEARRAHQLGHKAVVWTAAPQTYGLPHFNDKHWDPLWAVLQELELPVCLHIGSAKDDRPLWSGYSAKEHDAVGSVNVINGNIQVMGNLLFSGILERFPALKFISVESGVGWVPFLLETCEHQYDAQRLSQHGHPLRPTELFRRQCYVNFWFERSGIELRHMIGVDNILWEADFPHPTSTYPESRRAITESLKGVPKDEQVKMLQTNSERVFNIKVDPKLIPDSCVVKL
jgi:predicted TIM-barrel fold metal-dependent hydrolase